MGRELEASGAPPGRVTYLEVLFGIAVSNCNCVTSVLLSGLAPKANYIVQEEMMPKGGGAYCRNCCSKCGICCAALALELLLRIVVQNWKYCQWPCVDNYRSESLFKIRSMLQSR